MVISELFEAVVELMYEPKPKQTWQQLDTELQNLFKTEEQQKNV